MVSCIDPIHRLRHETDKMCLQYSSAEKLILSFDELIHNGDDIKYIALIRDADQNYKIKIPKGRLTKMIAQDDMSLTAVRNAMLTNIRQKVLLAFAWITGDANRMFERFIDLAFSMLLKRQTMINEECLLVLVMMVELRFSLIFTVSY